MEETPLFMQESYKNFESLVASLYLDGHSNQLLQTDDDIYFPGNSHYYLLRTFSPLVFLSQNLSGKDYNLIMKNYFDHDDDDYPFNFHLVSHAPIHGTISTTSHLGTISDYRRVLDELSEETQHLLDNQIIEAKGIGILDDMMKYFAQRQDRFKSAMARIWDYDQYDDKNLGNYVNTVALKLHNHATYQEVPELFYLYRLLKKTTGLEVAPKYLLYQLWSEQRNPGNCIDTIIETSKQLFEIELEEEEVEFAKHFSKGLSKRVYSERY